LLLKYTTGKEAPKGIYSTTVAGQSIADIRRQSVIWGCPEWRYSQEYNANDTYYSSTMIYPGYAMNYWALYPLSKTVTPAYNVQYLASWDKAAAYHAGYIKVNKWRQKSTERGLIFDSTLDIAIVYPHSAAIAAGTWQWLNNDQFAPYDNLDPGSPQTGQIFVECRHIKPGASRAFALTNPSINTLFCDGHVGTLTPKQAYNSIVFAILNR
jgi:prepilin-type processing-associated H-X9-DG protein